MIYILCDRDTGGAWTHHYTKGRKVKAYQTLSLARQYQRGRSAILVVDPKDLSATHWLGDE